MDDTFGAVLRSLREAAGLFQSGLAARIRYDRSLIGYVETGVRAPSADFAAACDRELGTWPLLCVLRQLGDQGAGDAMRRRTALAGTVLTAVSAVGMPGAVTVAQIVRGGFTPGDDDGEQVVAEYARRLDVLPNQQYGDSLLGHLLAAQAHTGPHATPVRLRTTATLATLYALWVGNMGRELEGRGWHRTAQQLAVRSGDPATQVHTLARAASRGPYEGATVAETLHDARRALDLSSTPTVGRVEAWAALVHLHALTGQLVEGRHAVGQMRDTADALGDPAAQVRALVFSSYLEARIGPPAVAARAYGEAAPFLKVMPVQAADAAVYYARSMIRAGDPAGGVQAALAAVRPLGARVQVTAIGVADVLAALPAGYRGPGLEELRGYAYTGPTPWEVLV